jgi:Tfp pilus assembly protein PilV
MNRSRHTARRRAQRGLSLFEVMITTVVLSWIFTAVVTLALSTSRATDRHRTEADLSNHARLAVDEMLSQLRASDRVLVSQSIGGATYSTGSSNIVFSAPGYDPTTTAVILPGVTDYIAYTYAEGTLRETIAPGAGSVRPARTNFIIAKKVTGVTYTYRMRDQFICSSSTSYTLNAAADPVASLKAYVNGIARTCTYNADTRQATVTSSNGDDVQFIYAVSPTANSGAWLQFVTEVDVAITLNGVDGRQITRTITVPGGARLRNRRL